MNWGHKITIVIVGFIIAMLGMVYLAYQQTNEMVDTNYYEKELKYQLKIDASDNLNAATHDTLITQSNDALIITIPENLRTAFANGKLEFIKNDDKKKDFSLHFQPDANGLFIIPKDKFTNGFYKIRIQWESNHKNYYHEQDIVVK